MENESGNQQRQVKRDHNASARKALCKQCVTVVLSESSPHQCPNCGTRDLLSHSELFGLTVAHVDCDAFYAAVEKRDRPDLVGKPVIIGGGQRGVVTTACYLARIRGVRSAMPMYQAKRLCPDAEVIKPSFEKYREAGQEVRLRMRALTPHVQPLSIDEAFMDFTGLALKTSPAQLLLSLARNVAADLGITLSVGLSHNKLMAKIASDQDKPDGFFIIGRAETERFLENKPVRILWGIGQASERSLARRGIRTVGALRRQSPDSLNRWYGSHGDQLADFAAGRDSRAVRNRNISKSVSSERTFRSDLSDAAQLTEMLLATCETTAKRLMKQGFGGRTVTLKLKTKDFRSITRSQTITSPTCLADVLFETTRVLLAREINGTAYRLIGVGVSDLCEVLDADPYDLADPDRADKKKLALLSAGVLKSPKITALERLRDSHKN